METVALLESIFGFAVFFFLGIGVEGGGGGEGGGGIVSQLC